MASYLRFQLNRKNRQFKRKLAISKVWLHNYLQRHVYGSWQKLGKSKALLVGWVFIVVVSLAGTLVGIDSLQSHHMVSAPDYGGTYAEGVLGKINGINPLFADNSASSDAIRLVFSGLTKLSKDREIAADLASSWEISSDKKVYTFTLREDVYWHDGTKFSAEDVAFTISRLQSPDAKSPLAANWVGVKYQVIDKRTIVLTLPTSYSSFLSNTTVGILPKHLLANVRPSLLNTHEFNQKPVGTGPFRVGQVIDGSAELVLNRNDGYYEPRAYLEKIKLLSFSDPNEFLSGYAKAQIGGFAFSKPELYEKSTKLSELKVHQLSLPIYTALFFNTKSSKVSNSDLRTALAYATNKDELIAKNLANEATKANYPILAGYSGYDPSLPKYQYSPEKAKEIIAKIDVSGLRDNPIRLATLKDSQYQKVAESVAKMWQDAGVNTQVVSVNALDLQQQFIRPRNYDVLLFGQDLGIDADAYAFWHSSQSSDPGLNLSQYNNLEADKLLEAGRIAKDEAFRATKYAAFLAAWTQDVPAIVLYTPNYFYAQDTRVKGFDLARVTQLSDRFNFVTEWYINTRQATKASQK